MLSAEDRAWLVARTSEIGAALHVDEVYKGLELDAPEPASWADDGAHVFASNSLSKALALPGLRLGWLVGPREDVYRAWSRKDYTSITTGALSEAIAERVLAPARREAILARSRDWLRGNRDRLAAWLETRDDFACELPSAGGMAFLSYEAPICSDEFSRRMREEESTLVVPGSCYGLEGHVRVGIGARPEVLSAGLERMGRLADRLAAQSSRRA